LPFQNLISLRGIKDKPGSSVSKVSDHGLDKGSIPGRGKLFFSSSLCVQTGSAAHPASYPMGIGGPFSRGKARPGRDADHSPHLVPRPSASMALAGQLFSLEVSHLISDLSGKLTPMSKHQDVNAFKGHGVKVSRTLILCTRLI
jgi:hypothetical protein